MSPNARPARWWTISLSCGPGEVTIAPSTSPFPSTTSTFPAAGRTTRSGVSGGAVTRNSNRLRAILPIALNHAARRRHAPCAHVSLPGFGAISTVAYPGVAGCTPSTCCVRKNVGAALQP